jgi:hypothetical protein
MMRGGAIAWIPVFGEADQPIALFLEFLDAGRIAFRGLLLSQPDDLCMPSRDGWNVTPLQPIAKVFDGALWRGLSHLSHRRESPPNDQPSPPRIVPTFYRRGIEPNPVLNRKLSAFGFIKVVQVGGYANCPTIATIALGMVEKFTGQIKVCGQAARVPVISSLPTTDQGREPKAAGRQPPTAGLPEGTSNTPSRLVFREDGAQSVSPIAPSGEASFINS